MPLGGPPMEVAIARLLAILQAIYVRAYSIMGTHLNFKGRQQRHDQHEADLDRLTLRLHRLVNWYLWNVTTAQDPLEQSRRDSLVKYASCQCVLEFTRY
jgi:hypothetical protein